MKPLYLSAIALLLSCTLFSQSEETIPLTGSWELTRVENIDEANRSFVSPDWVGIIFHFSENGSLALEHNGQFYLTTFQQQGQNLKYEDHPFQIDRQFEEYWTFLFFDEAASLRCRLHFVPTEETISQVPRQAVTQEKRGFPLVGTQSAAAPKPDGPIYKVVGQMPRFPGCEELGIEEEVKQCAQQELLKYVYRNLQYPADARQNRTEGTVIVTYVVEQDGSTSGFRVHRDIGDGCGEEALRVLSEMNAKGIIWTPGKQRGQPVRVQFNMPVKFKLE